MRGFLTAALAVLTITTGGAAQTALTDLQGGPITGPRDIETLANLAGDAPQPNQSYLAKQMQERMAACMAPMVWELANGAPDVDASAGESWRVDQAIHTATGWRVSNQQFQYRGTVTGQPYTGATVTFSRARWDPEKSAIHYGPTRVASKVSVVSDAKTKLIQNDSDADVDVTYSESESLTNSFSTSVTHGLTLDMTVSSETTVSGSYAGVSAEEKVTAEFGAEKSTEESRERSEEGTHEATIDIEFTAAAGEYYLVTIDKEHQTTYQPFDIDGVMDFDIAIDFGHEGGGRQRSRKPSGTVHLQGVAGLEQFVYGYDTNYPSMAGFWDTAYSRTKNGINCVLDSANRTIQVSGTNQANLESNADYKVESLGGSVPDQYRHLPVEHADDVGRR